MQPIRRWATTCLCVLIALAGLTTTATTVSAVDTTVAIPDAADMYTSSQTPDVGYGASTSLAAYSTPAITSVLRFALPVAPSGKTLSAARLRVRTTSISSAGTADRLNVRAASDSWSESTTTYASRPALGSAVLGTLSGATRPNTAYWINLDPAALRPLSGATTLAVQGTGKDSFWFWSRRHAAPSYRPLLELTFTDTVEPPPPPQDTSPPTSPTGLSSGVTGADVALSWSASTDDTAVTGYVVHRSTTEGFTPTTENRIATVPSTSYVDQGRPAGTWHYRMVARDAAGNTSTPSTSVAASVAALTQTTSTVLDAADMYVSANAPNDNLGTSSSLGVYGTPSVTSYLRFVVPSGPAGASLTGARLRFRTSSVASAGTANTINVRTASDSWNETTTTYATRPSVGSLVGTLAGVTVPDTTYWVPLNAAALGSTTGSTSLAIQGTGNDSLWLWSRRHAATANRPLLELTWSGDPAPLDPVDPSVTSTVVAAGDLVCPPGTTVTPQTCKHAEVRAAIDSVSPDRLIATGDLAQGLGSYAEFTAPGRFGDTFGDLGTKILPVIGNHEAYDPNASGYWNYFDGAAANTGRIGERPVGYYTSVIGSWRFIGLNSECDASGLAGGCGVGSPQYEWLRSLLRRDTAPCTVVAWHKPRWTTGTGHAPYLAMAPMWDLLATYGVDVTLAGHNHVAESFKPIGVSGTAAQPALSPTGARAFTVGIGGASQYSFTAAGAGQFSAMVARAKGTFGALKLTLKPSGYDWEFLPTAGSTFTNSGTTGAFSGSDSCR